LNLHYVPLYSSFVSTVYHHSLRETPRILTPKITRLNSRQKQIIRDRRLWNSLDSDKLPWVPGGLLYVWARSSWVFRCHTLLLGPRDTRYDSTAGTVSTYKWDNPIGTSTARFILIRFEKSRTVYIVRYRQSVSSRSYVLLHHHVLLMMSSFNVNSH
jgi:hypothetical protein